MIVVTCEIAVLIGQDHQGDQVFRVVVSWQYLKYAVMDLVMAGFSPSLWQHSRSFVSLSLCNPSVLTDGRPRHHRPSTSAPHRLNAVIPGKRVRAPTRRHGCLQSLQNALLEIYCPFRGTEGPFKLLRTHVNTHWRCCSSDL